MALQLYSWPRSSGTRIHWALEELGLPYEYVQLDAKKGEHRAAPYLAIQPHGKVPALVDDGVALFESAAILVHLGQQHGAARGLWPAPGDAAGRAAALSWTVWGATELGAYQQQFLYHGMDTPVSYKPEDRSAACAAYNRSQLVRCLDALEARLTGREHLLGGFTLADIGCASALRFGLMFGLPLDAHPQVAAWVARCTARPACARAQ